MYKLTIYFLLCSYLIESHEYIDILNDYHGQYFDTIDPIFDILNILEFSKDGLTLFWFKGFLTCFDPIYWSDSEFKSPSIKRMFISCLTRGSKISLNDITQHQYRSFDTQFTWNFKRHSNRILESCSWAQRSCVRRIPRIDGKEIMSLITRTSRIKFNQ